jgi:excisionase family DNA binding protein
MPNVPQTEESADDLLKPGEVAALLRVSLDTVRRYGDAGDLPCITLPGGHRRYRRADVDALLRFPDVESA